MSDTTQTIAAYPALVEAREALDEGKQELAARLVMGHLRQHQGEPRGLALLGAIALTAGGFTQAERFLRAAIERGNDDIEVRRELAMCMNQQDRLDDALVLFDDLLRETPDDRQALAAVAWINDKLGRNAQAKEIYHRLTETYPKESAYWIGLGLSFRITGQTDEAVDTFRRAIAADPLQGQAWWELASIKSNILTDDDLKALERAVTETTAAAARAQQHFAIGRALHQRHRYAEAFENFAEANRLLSEEQEYNPQELSDEIDEVQRTFTRTYFDQLEPAGNSSEAPIFIVSLPRAGSTLAEQMIGSHPDVEPLGEITYVPSLIRVMMERATLRGPTTVPQAIAALSKEERNELGAEYLRRAAAHRKGSARRFTDKMPHNWTNMIFVKHILPNAKFVEIRRAPIASGFGNFSHWFTRAHASSFSLEHIGKTYVDYVRLVDHVDQAAPGMIHHVRYEDLVENPEPVMRGTLDYLALPWDEKVLRFYETDRVIRTPSAEQVRRPLNREGIGAWLPYRQWLGPLFEALGPLADEELAEADRA